MDVKEATILGDKAISHWYYATKGRALIEILKSVKVSEVLDVGAGSGIFAKILIEAGISQSAVCVDPAYLEDKTESHLGRPIRYVRSVQNVSASLILIMDVLEHVDHDVGLIQHYSKFLSPGGKVLVTVPSFRFLWSGHDVFLAHRRRYTLSEIEKKIKVSGLSVICGRYFFGILFPLVVFMRLADRVYQAAGDHRAASMLRNYPPKLNKILTDLHDIERRFMFPFNRFAGLTIFCLAEKA